MQTEIDSKEEQGQTEKRSIYVSAVFIHVTAKERERGREERKRKKREREREGRE